MVTYYKFITEFAAERIFKIGVHLAKFHAGKMVDYVLFFYSFCTFVPEDTELDR